MGIPVVSCGHDHANDFCMFPDPHGLLAPAKNVPRETVSSNLSKMDKIWMCYAGGAGFGGYGGYGGYVRRIRFFEFDANKGRITTWKRLEAGETTKKIDEHPIVDQGRVIVPDVADTEDTTSTIG